MLLLFLALISPGLAAICNSASSAPWSDSDRLGILKVHNNLRSKIARGAYVAGGTRKGPASDMLKMVYDCGLEESAQRWANSCPTGQAGSAENIHWRYSNGGLNIAGQGEEASRKWERELEDHGWSSSGTQSGIKQATKMVWSRTSKIGCGVKQCQGGIVVVCHYSPAGNVVGQNVYSPGSTCSACPAGTTCSRSSGLCTTGQSQGEVDQREEDQWTIEQASPLNDWDDIMQMFQHRFDNQNTYWSTWARKFQEKIDSIIKQRGQDWGQWKGNWVDRVPKFRKFWESNQDVFGPWINCRRGQGIGTEWTDGAFRFRCEEGGRTGFVGCVVNDGSLILDGETKTIEGFENRCNEHANGTMTMEIVQKQNDFCRDSQGNNRRNGEAWIEGNSQMECRNNRATIIGWQVAERKPETQNFELSGLCAEPLHLGDSNCPSNKRPSIMWHMDKETLTCLAFKYSGCGGNSNRFSTIEECQRTCLPADFQSCPANSKPVKRADNTSHCTNNGTASLDCPRGAVCKMGYGVGLCCDSQISARVNANYQPDCGRFKKLYKSPQFGDQLIHLGKSCDHGFCPTAASCHRGDYFAYCCQ